MKFTESEKQMIIDIYKISSNITEAAQTFCTENDIKYTDSIRRAVSKVLEYQSLTTNKVLLEDTEDFKKASTRELKKSKYYLITYEQSKTPIHTEFYNNLLAYKKELKAELCVILGRYKNPTSIFNKSADNWNEATSEYWDANRHDIHHFLTVLGDIKVQPTAVNPLSGFEMITGNKTAIIGHPQLHLEPMAVLEHHPKKILMTTGAVTVPNYTDTRSGKQAEAHHKLGFVIVEIKNDKTFFVRQVEALFEDGSFIDLNYQVKDNKVTKINKAKALTWGDTHVGSLDPIKAKASCTLQKAFNIDTEIHHDITDGGSVNNHIYNDPINMYKRHIAGKDSVSSDIKQVKDFISSTIKRGVNTIIIPAANHNDRFDRWLQYADWKKDPINGKEYIKYVDILLNNPDYNKGIIAYLLDQEFKDNVITLHTDDSYMIDNVEYSQHGHIGANGSRGSFLQFKKANIPQTTAHTHAPRRYNDVMSAGTSTYLREGYNKGMSSWLHCDVIHHINGTRQQIIYIDGEFTTRKL